MARDSYAYDWYKSHCVHYWDPLKVSLQAFLFIKDNKDLGLTVVEKLLFLTEIVILMLPEALVFYYFCIV